MEPVIGAGGVLPPPEGYVQSVAEICRDTGVLFLCDSVICGFGRLGTWLGFERFGVEPDLVTLREGRDERIPAAGRRRRLAAASPSRSGRSPAALPSDTARPTRATRPVCAAALANIDILEREGLIPRGQELEDELLATLAPLADHPLVGEVRGGTGMLVGVAFDPDAVAADPALPTKAYKAIRPHGVLLRALGSSLAVSPPLTISSSEIALIRDAVQAGLDALVENPVQVA